MTNPRSEPAPGAARTASETEGRVAIAAVVIPFAAFLAALWLLWGGAVSALDLGILAAMYSATAIGVTVGFHRLLTHRAFAARGWLRGLLATLGSMSVQGAVIEWVADHRKHHAFTDDDGDPHSPHTHGGQGWRAVLRGLWHSHMGWFWDGERTDLRRFAPDLYKDPSMRWIDRLFPFWVALGLAIPFAAGLLLSGGELKAGLTAFLWAGLVRVFLLHHVTWSVNSICHLYGKRPFVSEDESRNNPLVALLSMGEGWHHNHHAFPTSARHGLDRFQLDPSFRLIRVFERLGWAWDVKQPSPERLAAKRARPPAPAHSSTPPTQPAGTPDPLLARRS